MGAQRRTVLRARRSGAVIVGVLLATAVALAPAGAAVPRAAGEGRFDLRRVTWARSPVDPPGAGNLSALATDGKRFVLGGLAQASVAGFVPIWTSMDGVRWTQAKGPASAFAADTVVSVLAYSHGKFYAFGVIVDGGEMLAWTSPDGTKWRRYQPKGFPPAPGSTPQAVTVTKKGLLLQTLQNAQEYQLWSSTGDKWRIIGEVPGDPSAVVKHVVVGTGSAKYVAAGRTSNVAAWTSTSGAQWTPASIAGPNPTEYESINDLVVGGPGFVAVGVVNGASGSEIAATWSSRDGRQWVTGREMPSLVGTAGVGMEAATSHAGAKMVLVAGHDGDELVVWASGNGAAWLRAPSSPVFDARKGSNVQAVAIASTKKKVVVGFREKSFDANRGQFVLRGLGVVAGTIK